MDGTFTSLLYLSSSSHPSTRLGVSSPHIHVYKSTLLSDNLVTQYLQIISSHNQIKVFPFAGGLTAVIYTDALQTVILISGATVLAVLGMCHFEGVLI